MSKPSKIKLYARATPGLRLLSGPGYEIVAEATGTLTLTTTLKSKVLLDDAEKEKQLIVMGNAGAEWPIKQDANSKTLVASANIRVIELASEGEKIIIVATSTEES